MIGDTREQVARELVPHEQLLWFGRPRQGFVLRTADAYMIPFSLMWAGFAVFWETIVNLGRGPLLFRLWGIPFVLAGLYMIPSAEDLARKQDITTVLLAISELRAEVQRDLKQTTRWMIALFLPLWAGVAGTVVAIALKH
jgi:hypothetical protein